VIINKYIDRIVKTAGKKGPEHGAGIIKKGIGNVIGSDFCKSAEYKGVHNSGKERTNDKPQGAQYGLLVQGYEIPLDKKKNQIPVTDQIPNLQIQQLSLGSNN
jgi:hypothetical protein